MLRSTPAVRESDLVAHPKEAGKFLVKATPALLRATGKRGQWLSALPDGTFEPSDDTGEYQTVTRDGNRIAFTCATQYVTGVLALPLVEGL